MKEFFALPKQIQIREGFKFLTAMLGNTIFPFMALYYSHYFGNFWTGILLIVTQLVNFVSTLYGGHLTDSLGRKKVTDFGNLGVCLGFVMVVLANIPHHVFPLLTFWGFLVVEAMHHFSQPAYEAMLIDLTDESNRKFVYTISYWLVNIAVMLGAGLAGLFYESHFFELVLAMALLYLLIFYYMWKHFEETQPTDAIFSHGTGVWDIFQNYGDILKDRVFLMYVAGCVGSACIWLQIDTWLPIHYAQNFQVTSLFGVTITGPKMLSLSVFINTFMIVFLMTHVSKWTKKLPVLPQYIIGFLTFATGIFLAMQFRTLLGIALAAVLYTIGEMLQVPASQLLRIEMMDEDKLGSYSGFLALAQPLGNILAGMMVSLTALTGPLGLQISFLIIVEISLSMIIKAEKLHRK
ncbi:MFS transporter [Streptococcus himalayensis]|nr:MFS transporter [Streptococcus himalayensis]